MSASDGVVELADNTQPDCCGFVLQSVGVGQRVQVKTTGILESPDWPTMTDGDPQPGWTYYLSDVPGKISRGTSVAGTYQVPVGKALSKTRFAVECVTGSEVAPPRPEYRDIVLTLTNSTDETIPAGTGVTRPDPDDDTTCCPCVWDDICIGLAAEDIAPHTDGAVRVEGVLELEWTAATGNATLTVGAKYYNDFDDMSKLTTESGGDRQWIGLALSETQMMVAKRFAAPRGFYPLT